MDLNAAGLFVQVVQAGSLSGAAERAHVPLPTVSRRIRELERQLRVQLFERSKRGMRVTDAGQRLYEYAVRGIETLAEGELAVASAQSELRGRLRLSIPPAFEPWWRLLNGFRRRYPDIALSVYASERRIDLVNDGVDVALRIGAVVDESMIARRIAVYRHVVVAAPSLIARLGEPRVVDDLQRYPVAVWAAGGGEHSHWRLGDAEFRPRPVLATNDYLHLRALALAGEAVVELPPFLAAETCAEGRLARLLPDAPLPEQQAHLLYPAHRHPSTLVRAYLDYCRREAPALLTG
jgi:DNA-binding transcriptional LysR family regulator